MPAPGWKTLTLKDDLIEQLDAFIRTNRDGYSNRAEVVAAALRRFLDEERLKGAQRDPGKIREVFDDWLVKAKQDLARDLDAETKRRRRS